MGKPQIAPGSPVFAVPRRWMVLALVLLMQVFTAGTFTYSFSFWVEPWRNEFGVERADVMTVITLRIYAVAIASFLLGKILDRFPQRLIATAGILAYCASMLAVGISGSLFLITLVYMFLVPVAFVLAGPMTAIVFVTQVFEHNRGLAIGIATLGTSLGGTIIPNACAWMIAELGWRQAHMVLGLSSLCLLPLAWIILIHRPAQKEGAAGDRAGRVTNLSMLGNPNFWVVVLSLTVSYAVFSAIQFNLVPLTTDLGLDLARSALVVTTMALAMLCGKVAVGFLADRMDQRILFLVVVGAIAAGLLVLLLLPVRAVIYAAFGLIGLGSGGLLPLKGTIMGAAFGPKKIGQAMGLAAPFMSVYAMGPYIAGKVRDDTGNYDSVLMLCVAGLVLTSPIVLFLRQTKRDEAEVPSAGAVRVT